MEKEELKIEIEYGKKDGSTKILNILSSEYYEAPDKNEILEYDSTPKHIEQHAYIDENFKELDWSILRIYDKAKALMMICEEKYWGESNSHSMLIISLYKNNELDSWEQTIEISENKTEAIHVLKLSTSTSKNVGGLMSHTIVEGTGERGNVVVVKSNE